jgi:structural maintenance of chromosome 3 (chondroitin sulfate proteoglycan 6)
LQEQQREHEKFLAKKALLMRQKEECLNNIRDLGTLPEEAFEKYAKTNTKKVNLLCN